MAEVIFPDTADAGLRLDVYLSDQYDDMSRSYLQSLIKGGRVLADGVAVRQNYRIRGGERIDLTIPEPEGIEAKAEDIPLSVLYEDDHLIFIDKPKDMVVHPSAGHSSGTVVNALLFHCEGQLSGINGVLRPGIVHRIDKDTSGVIVACKDDLTHRGLAEQFALHSITRRYVAIVHGTFSEKSGTVDANIGRSSQNRLKNCVRPDGKRAVTHYRILAEADKYSLVECTLETGRTHQIRVHMDHINHPLLGDKVYGNRPDTFRTTSQALHAQVLGLIHPITGEYIEVCSPLPEYFTDLCRKCGLSVK